jgi:hypothetical protein
MASTRRQNRASSPSDPGQADPLKPHGANELLGSGVSTSASDYGPTFAANAAMSAIPSRTGRVEAGARKPERSMKGCIVQTRYVGHPFRRASCGP